MRALIRVRKKSGRDDSHSKPQIANPTNEKESDANKSPTMIINPKKIKGNSNPSLLPSQLVFQNLLCLLRSPITNVLIPKWPAARTTSFVNR
jgi:hypothetical protein